MTQNKTIIKGKEIDFIKELGLENMSPEKQEVMLERMGKIVNKRIILRALDHLSEEETKKTTHPTSEEVNGRVEGIDENVPSGRRSFTASHLRERKVCRRSLLQRDRP